MVLVYAHLNYVLTVLGFWGDGRLNTGIFMEICVVFLEAGACFRCFILAFSWMLECGFVSINMGRLTKCRLLDGYV